MLSLCNSIIFAHIDGLMPSFSNTLSYNERFNGILTKQYIQHFPTGWVILVQFQPTLADPPTLTKHFPGGGSTIIEPVSGSAGGCLIQQLGPGNEQLVIDYVARVEAEKGTVEGGSLEIEPFEWLITVENGDCFQLTITTFSDKWESEVIQQGDMDGFLKIQAFNFDPPRRGNNFEFDFTTVASKANRNTVWVNANLLNYSPAGESIIYDNQNEKVKLKSSLFRSLKFETGEISRQMAEKIQVFADLDQFVINDRTYVVEDLTEPEPLGRTNMFSVSLTATKQNIVGMNTHDVGYDCNGIKPDPENMGIINIEIKNATINGQIEISNKYAISQIIIGRKAGTGTLTFKAGSSAGAPDIMAETPIGGIVISNTRYTPVVDGTWTLFYSITGTGADFDIYIQTIPFKN